MPNFIKFYTISLTLLFIAFAFTSIISAVTPDIQTENSWETKPTMPRIQNRLKAVTVEDKIYVFGHDFTMMYDPATEKWINKSTMPTPRAYFGIATVNGKVYVIGGRTYSADQNPSIINEVYDVQTGTWQTKQPMTMGRMFIEANVINGKIYILGGVINETDFTNTNTVYDPVTNTWTEIASSPSSLNRYCSCSFDDKIYVFNDRTSIYNSKTDSWTQGQSPPQEFKYSGIGATTGQYAPKKVYVMGGMKGNSVVGMKPQTYNYAYDPATDSWTLAAPMPSAVCEFSVAIVKDKLYTIGGDTTLYSLTSNGEVQVYTPIGYHSNPQTTSTPSSLDPTSEPFNVTGLAVVVGCVIAGVVIAVTLALIISFRHKPKKQ
jgi:hypothetical protein